MIFAKEPQQYPLAKRGYSFNLLDKTSLETLPKMEEEWHPTKNGEPALRILRRGGLKQSRENVKNADMSGNQRFGGELKKSRVPILFP